MARRKPGTLLPIEIAVLEAGIEVARGPDPDFHGFAIARVIQEREGARRLTAHGTLYKALGRMETAGLLESHWEDPTLAVDEGRPRRRLYRVTPLAAASLARARAVERSTDLRPGLAPS